MMRFDLMLTNQKPIDLLIINLGTNDLKFVDAYMASKGAESLINIAKAGFFSSDRSIRDYAEDIWDMKPVGGKR